MKTLILLTSVLLTGCSLIPFKAKPTIKPQETSKLDSAIVRVDEAQVKVQEVQEKRDSRIKAGVVAVKTELELLPTNPPLSFSTQELGLIQTDLLAAKDDPGQIAAVSQRRSMVMEGRAEEARKAYANAASERDKLALELTQLRKEKEELVLARNLARDNEIKLLEKNRIDNQKAIDDVRDRENKAFARKQAWVLYIVGFLGLAVFAAGGYLGKLAGVRATLPFGVGGLICLGLAQIVTQWWFKWAALGSTALIAAVVIWWAFQKYREGVLKEEAQSKANKLKSTLAEVVPILDDFYENASKEVRDALDAGLFNELSKKMDEESKRIVKLIRAGAPIPNEDPKANALQSQVNSI